MGEEYPQAACPGAPAPKKKTHPLAWVLVAIGGVLLLFGLLIIAGGLFLFNKAKQAGFDPDLWAKNPAAAAARMIAAANPDAELVRVDERKGIVVIREKSTGKTFTINFEDVKRGRIVFSDDRGETVALGGAAKLPDWVPVYAGAKPELAAAGEGAERSGGTYQFTTRDSVSAVAGYYKAALEKAGFTINAETAQPGVATVSGDDEAGGRMVNVTLVSEGQETRVHVVYSQSK